MFRKCLDFTSLLFNIHCYDEIKVKEVLFMLKIAFNGFMMALADSVPGVSGGTVAFIMGFYDCFISSIYDLLYGNIEHKKSAICYLIKLAVGWIFGMLLAVIILSSLFEKQIYQVSSLFIGFILGSIPLIINEEKDTFKQLKKGILFCILGITVVALITFANSYLHMQEMKMSQLSLSLFLKLFIVGMLAISAMFLPGISGSTILLIFGAYIPVITSIKEIISFHFSAFGSLVVFGFGVLFGVFSIVKLIKYCLEKYKVQTLFMVLGMMIGSFYAIIMGPTTLAVKQLPLDFQHFHIIYALIGLVLVLFMQFIKERSE